MSKSELKRLAYVSPTPKVNILVAFPYFSEEVVRRFEREPRENYRLIVDSGAFTAHQSGKPVSIDAYCKFLDSIEKLRPFNAVQLDVIGDHEATFKNYELMKGRGYDVIPVFTRGSPIELLEELYQTTDYVLIGGVAFGEQRRNYVKYLAPHLTGKNRRYHLLGFTDNDFIKKIKPYSVDSSAWESGGRYGRLYLYQGFGKFRQVGREMFFPKVDPSMEGEFRRMGLSSKETAILTREAAWAGGASELTEKGAVRFIGGYAHVLMALDIEKHVGTKYFLALTTRQALDILLSSRSLIDERRKEGLL